MDIDVEFKAVEANTAPTTVCSRCGAMPTLVKTLLDSRKGKSVRIIQCSCGEQRWCEEA